MLRIIKNVVLLHHKNVGFYYRLGNDTLTVEIRVRFPYPIQKTANHLAVFFYL